MQNPYGGGPPPGYGQYPQQPQAYPPQGYPQHPVAPIANGQWGPQGQPMKPRVVFGVPLEPNERVLYFVINSRMPGRIFLAIMSIPMVLMLGLGIYLMYLAITDRSHSIYAQTITNKRIMAIDGHGKPKFAIRWEEVAGLNKVIGKRYEFGVRNRAGEKFMFSDNVEWVEKLITKYTDNPMAREQDPEVWYDHNVN